MTMQIQTEPFIDHKDTTLVQKVLKRKYLTEDKYTKIFEENIKKIVKSKYAIAISNWTMGLYACLEALEISRGDEVIVPNITFIATSNAVLLTGAKVVLSEVNYEDMCLNVYKAKKLINSRTKAIIPVHLYGTSCDMDLILGMKKKYNIKVIEDAAQAIGVKYKGQHVGAIGDCGGFSFYGNKLLTSGEGGVIVTNNKKIAQNIFQFKNHGRKKKGIFVHEKIGYNFMFTEIQAALGITQLKKLKKIIFRRKNIFEYYKKLLINTNGIRFKPINKKISEVFWFTNIYVKNANLLEIFLAKLKIQTRRVFSPLHLQPCYKFNNRVVKTKDSFQISEKLHREVLSLPTYHRLADKKISYIANQIKKFFK